MAGKLDWLAAGLAVEGREATSPRAGAVARTDVPTCHLDDRVGSVRERVRAGGWNACVVVNDERVVLGLLEEEAIDSNRELTAEQAMLPGPATFRPHVPIEELAHRMVDHEKKSALVTTSDGRLVGMVLVEDATHAAHTAHSRGPDDE